MMFRNFAILLLATIVVQGSPSNLRTALPDEYDPFRVLKDRFRNAKLRPELQGKTLQDLGIQAPLNRRQLNRRGVRGLFHFDEYLYKPLQGNKVQFFSIYDEFGPAVSNKLGETVGLNGLIYNFDRFNGGAYQGLKNQDIIGSLKGGCTIVGSNDNHFCTYELLIATDVPPVDQNPNFGSVIASGSLDFRERSGGFLMVEAAGDDFSYFMGGILSLEYAKIGDETVIVGELVFS